MPRALAALALMIASPAAAQPANDTAAARAAEQAFVTAQRQGDRAALEALIAPDFLFVRASGRIGNRGDYVAGFTDPKLRMTAFEVSDPLLLRAAPGVTIIGGEGRVAGTYDGRPFTRQFRFSDTLVLRDGRWQVAFLQVTPLPAE